MNAQLFYDYTDIICLHDTVKCSELTKACFLHTERERERESRERERERERDRQTETDPPLCQLVNKGDTIKQFNNFNILVTHSTQKEMPARG